MNEEEIINEIGFCLSGEWISLEHEQAIKGLLDLYNQEKEKNKKLEEDIKVCEIMEKSHKKEIDQLILKLNKSLEVIDLMAEELPINAEICDKLKDSKNDCYADIEDEKACSNCIKEYYFKKAKESKNE